VQSGIPRRFQECSDCHVDLVDHLPVEEPARAPEALRDFEVDRFAPEPDLVVIRTYQNGLDADLAKSVLEAAGIDSMIRNNDTGRRHYYGLTLQGIQLVVRAEDAEDAEKILDIDVRMGMRRFTPGHEWLLQEARKSCGSDQSSLYALQFLLDSQNATSNTGNGSRFDRSARESGRGRLAS